MRPRYAIFHRRILIKLVFNFFYRSRSSIVRGTYTQVKLVRFMPRFTGLPPSRADLRIEAVSYVLLEKNCILYDLADLHAPCAPQVDRFHAGCPPCYHQAPIAISVKYATGVHLLHFYPTGVEIHREGVYCGFSKLVGPDRVHPTPYRRPQKDELMGVPFAVYTPTVHDNTFSVKPGIGNIGLFLQHDVLKRVLVLVVGKAEHKGFRSEDVDRIVKSSTIGILSRLNYLLKRTLPYWVHNHIWVPVSPTCGWKRMVGPRYRVHRLFFRKSLRFQGGPCVHCPTQSECTPQGNINPFECVYIEAWETPAQSPSSSSRL